MAKLENVLKAHIATVKFAVEVLKSEGATVSADGWLSYKLDPLVTENPENPTAASCHSELPLSAPKKKRKKAAKGEKVFDQDEYFLCMI